MLRCVGWGDLCPLENHLNPHQMQFGRSVIWVVIDLPTALCLPLGLVLGRIQVEDCQSVANAVLMNNPSLANRYYSR